MSGKELFEVCDCDVIHEARSAMEGRETYARLAGLMKMFGDGTRVEILHALEKRELCVCDIAALLGVTKSAASHQLKTLRMSNLVKSRRDGQNVFYSLADDHVKDIIDIGLEHLREDRS